MKHNHKLWFSILVGETPLPEHMYIAPECRNQHGAKKQTLRYKSNHQCVYCTSEAHKRINNRRYYNCGNAVHDAAHLMDELMLRRQLKEVWE